MDHLDKLLQTSGSPRSLQIPPKSLLLPLKPNYGREGLVAPGHVNSRRKIMRLPSKLQTFLLQQITLFPQRQRGLYCGHTLRSFSRTNLLISKLFVKTHNRRAYTVRASNTYDLSKYVQNKSSVQFFPLDLDTTTQTMYFAYIINIYIFPYSCPDNIVNISVVSSTALGRAPKYQAAVTRERET